jgi:hypothetical protein
MKAEAEVSKVPQLGQKLAPSGTMFPHLGQFIISTVLGYQLVFYKYNV